MPEHRWSGWPGAWCLDCGCSDPREDALADGGDPMDLKFDVAAMECKEPGSGRHDPYKSRPSGRMSPC
jgi:hypothetical protein